MASLKEVKTRINSIRSTRKITSAMKMVASAKLHKMQGAVENMLPYQQKLDKILNNFLSADLPVQSPFILKRELKRIAIVAFSSNTSLCGAYNANVIRQFNSVYKKYKEKLGAENILVYPIGNKIELAVKKMGIIPQGSYQSIVNKPSYQETSLLAQKLMDLFLNKEIDQVEVIYHHFKSSGVQELQSMTYLPIDLSKVSVGAIEEPTEKSVYNNDYIIEPSPVELLANLLPMVLKYELFTSAVDSNASEHSARTIAMQTATDNADDIIRDLTKLYNKSRQQSITNELLDIMGGSAK
ncbi:MAG: F0F1 ATP synthase subunit gamma [Bacteroidaceae bacterium]|nr:F0F1 ATP synthase subunit gamma [Bacteroidaceae bacterium]